ncbi:hypothetical protein, partial [Bradyrhizobium altum]|uniref:hypothetical protein n=1 Tax=Bradyrhizobium altum TaxID=1571202 RepID=UPI001E517C36
RFLSLIPRRSGRKEGFAFHRNITGLIQLVFTNVAAKLVEILRQSGGFEGSCQPFFGPGAMSWPKSTSLTPKSGRAERRITITRRLSGSAAAGVTHAERAEDGVGELARKMRHNCIALALGHRP